MSGYLDTVPKCATDSCDALKVLLTTTVCLRFPVYKTTGNGLRLNVEEHCIALRAAGKNGMSCHYDYYYCFIFKPSDYINLGRCLKALCAEESSLKEQISFSFILE